MTTFDNTDLSAAASAIKPQLEIERLITTGAIYNPNTSKKELYEQQVIADRASNQLESIRRSVGHSGDTGRNTTSLRERYEQQLIADKAENQLRRAAAISKYQLRASLPQTPPSSTPPQKNTSYSRKASDQHSVATASTAALSLYSTTSTEYDLLDNSLFEGDGLSREELATAIEFGFVEYDYDNDNDNETQPQHDDETPQPALDKDEEYVSFAEGQARAKAKRMARAEVEEKKKRMNEEEKKVKEEERLRMEAAKKKEQEEEKQRLEEAEVQAKKKKEREEEKRRIQERIANMESSKDKKDWQKTYKEWQMKYAR